MKIGILEEPSSVRVAKVQSITGFTFVETSHCANLSIRKHAHEHAYFGTVLDGTLEETIGHSTRERQPFLLAFRPSGEEHGHASGSAGARGFNIGIDPNSLERLRDFSGRLQGPAEIPGPSVVWLITRLYGEFHGTDALAPLVMESLAMELLVYACRRWPSVSDSRPPRWLRQARELIAMQFMERLTLEEVAGAVDVHPGHLARAFRRHYHCTVGDYVRQLRVEFAARELCVSESPLVDIAHAAGFCDQSHFSQTFKRVIGVTPARFRVTARKR